MIDCHVHTYRSHHGEGDLEDYIKNAILKKVKVLGFSEHGPISPYNNLSLTIEETHKYFSDIEVLKNKYIDRIKILTGIEIDYFLEQEEDIKNKTRLFKNDFILGSVHNVYINGELISIYDYDKVHNVNFCENYFNTMASAIKSGIFDAIAHPDLILRAGFYAENLIDYFYEIAELMKNYNVAYEINTSGLYKTSYDATLKKCVKKDITYPYIDFIKIAYNKGVTFTIGSDAHIPEEVCQGIPIMLNRIKKVGINKICYIEKNMKKTFDL